MERPPRSRIPRVVMVVVPLLALGLAVFLVGMAWRANRTTRIDDGEVSPSDDAVPLTTETDVFLTCSECHGDLDLVFKQGRVPTLLYTHADHFAAGVSDCSVCHPANTHEPDKINKPTMSRCFTCHGTAEAAIASGECDLCHPPDIPASPPSHQESGWAKALHTEQALTDQFQCLTCHEQKFCDSCHGVTMPHAEGWAESPHAMAFFDEPTSCQTCHPRAEGAADECDTCHHPQAPRGTPWIEVHPSVVKSESAFTCFQCHSEETCSVCHVRGKEDFSADQKAITMSPTPAPTGG